MATNNAFSFGGFLDAFGNNTTKALGIWRQIDDARDDKKLRAKELDNQTKMLSVQVAEQQKERELATLDAARSIAFQDNLFKVINIAAIAGLAGVGGWAVAKAIKAFRR